MTDILVPTEQEGTKAVVKTWLKKIGDSVRADEPLVELETDKVAVEIAAPARRRARRKSSSSQRATSSPAPCSAASRKTAATAVRKGGRCKARRSRPHSAKPAASTSQHPRRHPQDARRCWFARKRRAGERRDDRT